VAAVKICGMRELENIAAVAALQPEYLGFICWSGSKRFIGETLNAAALDRVSGNALRVGVFVNQDAHEIAGYVQRLGLSVVQLHGDEAPEFCRELRAVFPVGEIWKSLAVSGSYPADEVALYDTVVDRLLFDTSTPDRGGSGVAFDWSLLKQHRAGVPLVLSGGLSADNVERALAAGIPELSIVDLNSRLESSPGLKDPALVARAITVIRDVSEV
jgi:phosphoribosylanthranilate isomerase